MSAILDFLNGNYTPPKPLEPAVKEPPVLQPALPDAVVLCTVRTKCTCGRVHESPNPGVMLRYDKTITKPGVWPVGFNSLPRERVVREATAAACDACFDDKQFGKDDFK